MLFTPEAHEALMDEPWSTQRVRTAIASVVADAESAFDDGWPMHPQDVEDDDDPAARWRTVYLGGAGVVDAFHRLARRGYVELRRDYVPYLERSLEVQPDLPDEDAERLYERLGWTRVGVIPGYALYPDGRPCDTTVFWKAL